MTTNRPSLKEMVDELDAQVESEEQLLWGSPGGVNLANSPRFKEILQILHEQPLLVQPVVEWLRQMKAKMAMAQLQVLYTPEQIEEMTQQLS